MKQLLEPPHPVHVLRQHAAIHGVRKRPETAVFQLEQECRIVKSFPAEDRDNRSDIHAGRD